MMNRRVLIASLAALAATSARAAAPPRELTVYKTASCGCCRGWVTHARRAGFQPKVTEVDDVGPIWRRHGVPDELSSCHVSEIGGYVVVGHVPLADVHRLLRERPKAIGLTVPGMPFGSPGMEQPGGGREAYDTLLLVKGRRPTVFARHS